jgi:hypothetical protein
MKSFDQVRNSFGVGNSTTPLELSYAAMLLGVLAAQQTALEAVKADVDTAVTELDQDATAELLAAQTAINGLVTEVHANPFAETLSRLSAYKGSPAYTHLETLLHEKAQNFGR